MKKSYYQISQEISPQIYLCSSFVSGCHIVLSGEIYALYEREDFARLERLHPTIFERLAEARLIVEDDLDEYQAIRDERRREREDSSMYHIIINPTLDCNLSCWYCYENRVPKSRMSEQTIEAVCKHIVAHHEEVAYTMLKLSFFGGEPFLKFGVIKQIATFAQEYCAEHGVELLLDFTTNGTLCSKPVLEFLKDFRCMFQITLDGNREQHNKIKFTRSRRLDTFSQTIENIRRIQAEIERSFVAVRINYDKDTLDGFQSILQELQPLDRKKTKVILKKIWQVDPADISRDQVEQVIETLFAHNFVVDYYSQGGICFADRHHQATINYDGRVFKCTTIARFDEPSSLGVLDPSTGRIEWNEQKMEPLLRDDSPEECKVCRMYPSCGGPCQRHMSEHPNWSCFLKRTSFDLPEFVLTQFRTHLIKYQVYEGKI